MQENYSYRQAKYCALKSLIQQISSIKWVFLSPRSIFWGEICVQLEREYPEQ